MAGRAATRVGLAAVAVAAGLLLLAGTPADAQDVVAADEISQSLKESLGLEVLRVERAELESGPVYWVTVMEPGGNANSAFQVSTVAVDARTGRLVLPLRRKEAGLGRSWSPAWSMDGAADGIAIRRKTFGK